MKPCTTMNIAIPSKNEKKSLATPAVCGMRRLNMFCSNRDSAEEKKRTSDISTINQRPKMAPHKTLLDKPRPRSAFVPPMTVSRSNNGRNGASEKYIIVIVSNSSFLFPFCIYINVITTTSQSVPTRIGGPQVPTPLEVNTCIVLNCLRP